MADKVHAETDGICVESWFLHYIQHTLQYEGKTFDISNIFGFYAIFVIVSIWNYTLLTFTNFNKQSSHTVFKWLKHRLKVCGPTQVKRIKTFLTKVHCGKNRLNFTRDSSVCSLHGSFYMCILDFNYLIKLCCSGSQLKFYWTFYLFVAYFDSTSMRIFCGVDPFQFS